MDMSDARKPVGHCKECGKPIYVGDNAGTIPSLTAKYGVDFICEPCGVDQGAVFPDDATIH